VIVHRLTLVCLLAVWPYPGLSADGPLVIAHRGACGYLPEHTLAAKALAHGMGADYLEQDVVLSKDGVPVVMHDIHLDTISDVAARFPGRERDDGRFYALDFTVEEMKQLEVTERVHHATGAAVYPGRFPIGASGLRIVTLDEELRFIAGLNFSTGRAVGVYPEIKKPSWHLAQGADLGRAVVEVLHRHGYRTKDDLCILQCFEFDEIKRLRGELGWRGRLLQAMGGGASGEGGSDFARMRTPEGLEELARWVDVIGPPFGSIITGASPEARGITRLVEDAHRAGLKVHAYTARQDDLPGNARSMDDLHKVLFEEAGIDGVFTDFPDVTRKLLGR
jgi:glycerophosphoryl diester phosphodiesterase